MRERLKEFLEETFLIDFDKVSTTENLFTTGYIDSFGMVELVSFIEENFDVEFSNEELVSDALTSLDNMVKAIKSKMPKE